MKIRGRRCHMRRKRGTQVYTEDFRREAVRLAEAGTKSPAEIARELDINPETLRLWRRRLGTVGAGDSGTRARARGDGGTVPSLEEENRRLRRENARLLEEREILKKEIGRAHV